MSIIRRTISTGTRHTLFTPKFSISVTNTLLRNMLRRPISSVSSIHIVNIKFLIANTRIRRLLRITLQKRQLVPVTNTSSQFNRTVRLRTGTTGLRQVNRRTPSKRLRSVTRINFPTTRMKLHTNCNSHLTISYRHRGYITLNGNVKRR